MRLLRRCRYFDDALLSRGQLDEKFRMKQFMDEFTAAGLIPAPLLRWELTGRLPGDVSRMLGDRFRVAGAAFPGTSRPGTVDGNP
jgi:hypothetical protein